MKDQRDFRTASKFPFRKSVWVLALAGLTAYPAGASQDQDKKGTLLRISWSEGQAIRYQVTEEERRLEIDRRLEVLTESDSVLTVTGVADGIATVTLVSTPKTSSIKIFDRKSGQLREETSNTAQDTQGGRMDARFRLQPNPNESDARLRKVLFLDPAALPSLLFQPSLPKGPVRVGEKWDDEFYVRDPSTPGPDFQIVRVPVQLEFKALQDSGKQAQISYAFQIEKELPNSTGMASLKCEGQALVDIETGIPVSKEEKVTYKTQRFSVLDGQKEVTFESDSERKLRATLKK